MAFGHWIQDRPVAVVGQSFVVAHRRTELLGVQIENGHLVAAFAQCTGSRRGNRVVEAVGVWMSNDNDDTHAVGTLVVPSTIALMELQGPRLVPVWAYLVSFVVLGSSLSFAGPALSHLRDRVGTDDGGISLIFVGSSTGYMVGSFLGGRWLDGYRGRH